MTARYLADKSAYTASRQARSTRLEDLIGTGLVASCAVIMLEMLFSARSRRDYEDVRTELSEACEQIPMDQQVMSRALDVQRLLAASGKHRGAGIPDLLIAATAESSDLTLLHCDHDFEAIVEVTGQRHEMIGRPQDSGSRSTPYVVLVGRPQRFDLAGQVDAISPQDAVARAVEHGLIRATEQQVVAISTRHWQPVAATDCIGSDH